MIVLGLTFGVSDAAVTGDAGAIGQAVVTAVLFVPAVWLLVGLTTTLIGLVPRATALAWAALGACLVIGMFGQLLDLASWVQDTSPFQHVPRYPAGDIQVVPLAVLVAIAAALTIVGLVGLQRRDIG